MYYISDSCQLHLPWRFIMKNKDKTISLRLNEEIYNIDIWLLYVLTQKYGNVKLFFESAENTQKLRILFL